MRRPTQRCRRNGWRSRTGGGIPDPVASLSSRTDVLANPRAQKRRVAASSAGFVELTGSAQSRSVPSLHIRTNVIEHLDGWQETSHPVTLHPAILSFAAELAARLIAPRTQMQLSSVSSACLARTSPSDFPWTVRHAQLARACAPRRDDCAAYWANRAVLFPGLATRMRNPSAAVERRRRQADREREVGCSRSRAVPAGWRHRAWEAAGAANREGRDAARRTVSATVWRGLL